jgi:hypothetical protein
MFNSERNSHKLVHYLWAYTVHQGMPWVRKNMQFFKKILDNFYADKYSKNVLESSVERSVHVLQYKEKNMYSKNHKLLGVFR